VFKESPTENHGRVHTSIVNIILLTKPEIQAQEVEMKDVKIINKRLDFPKSENFNLKKIF